MRFLSSYFLSKYWKPWALLPIHNKYISIILEVCTMRLDFESFNLLAGTGTIDALADCQDMFTIGGVSNITIFFIQPLTFWLFLFAPSCLVRQISQPFADPMQDNTVSIIEKDSKISLVTIILLHSMNRIFCFLSYFLVYVELGTGVSDSAELKFEFADVIGNRQFEMKVTQIICNSRMR